MGYRDLVVRRASPWDHSGFPRPIDPPGRVFGPRTMGTTAVAAVVAATLLGTGTVFALDALHHKGGTPVSAATLGPTTNPAPLASGPGQANPPGARHHAGHSGGAPGSTPQPSPAPLVAASSGPPNNPPPTTPAPHSHTPTPPPSSPPESPGILTVSQSPVQLTQSAPGGPYTGQFTLGAQGGPVSSYSILDPAPSGDLSITPVSGGPISSGGAITVNVTVASATGLSFETDLTVNPGGLTVILDYPPAG